MVQKITNDEYVQWVKENRPEFQVLEPYQNGRTKILHRHIPSGIEWKCFKD